MPGTRSSARITANGSSPSSSQDKDASANAGTKRKADANASPKPKRGKKTQKTLEETMPENDAAELAEEKQPGADVEGTDEQAKGIKRKSFYYNISIFLSRLFPFSESVLIFLR